jgi:murein DD-endopeptidase MepM/ murein hydrolase activator NlpD
MMQVISKRLLLLALMVTIAHVSLVPSNIAQEDNSPVTIHVVQRGETLFRIAMSYGLTVDAIAQVNGISDPASISVGQRLIIPSQQATVERAPSDITSEHVVQPGETLNQIAVRYNLTLDQLIAANNIANPDAIYIGQVLLLPQFNVASNPVIESVDIAYVMLPGETLETIADRYGITLEALLEANAPSDDTLIDPSQPIIIPQAQIPQTTAILPEDVDQLDIKPLVLAQGQAGRFRLVTSVPAAVTGTFLGQALTFASEENRTIHTAFVGVPVSTASNVYVLNLSVVPDGGEPLALSANMLVQPIDYGAQSVTIPEELNPLLAPGVEANELSILRSITSRYSPERYFNGPMGLPAAAVMNEAFGARRIYNEGAAESFHNGADFAAVPGAAVLASAPGRVVLSDMLHIRGNTVVLDHGWGIYSAYAHMAERNVAVGQVVALGEVLGTVGSTGRSTGAHLHWEVWVKGVPVDPMQWVAMAFP